MGVKMQGLSDIIERAFKLARSGTCRHPTDVRRRLRMEGYSHVDLFISGEGLEADLSRLCRTANGRSAEEMHIETVRPAERPVTH